MRRVTDHANASIGIAAAFECFEQKKELLGEHLRVLRWA
jgi:hypothetical protein